MEPLINKAKSAIEASYAPYSQFRVAAAVLGNDDVIYTGVNVENASYSLTQCAERTAICSAITAGAKSICAVVIYTPTQEPTPPCGACRQVIQEFGSDICIISVCDSSKRLEFTLDELLPASFTKNKLWES